jgi:hypothetical protein
MLMLLSSEAKISLSNVRQFQCNVPRFFHGVRLTMSPLGTAATVWLPDDRRW